ncbi:MAG: tRNA dihydrouridine synthase DusB [Bacilli bacterium]
MDFLNKNIESNVILAPMAGITNLAYREFMKKFGVGISYTEMVSDCGLIYKNKETYRYLETSEVDSPLAIQLFGGSKETLLQALKIVEEKNINYDFIDVNLGCPVVKVTKTGAGSAWLNRKEELYDMMSSLVKASLKPVFAKIRIGWDDNHINVYEIIEILQKAKVSLIAIHPRTRNQLYTGNARYELIKNIKEKMTVPLAISGDIFTLEQAIEYQKMTGADFIMVARGALGNPFLVTQISTYFKTGEILPSPTLKQNLNYLKEHFEKLISLKGEETATKEMRGIAPHYLKGYPNTKSIRNLLATQMKTYQDFLSIISSLNESD